MTPEYLRELADIADPDKLWSQPGLNPNDLPPEKRHQLDMGIAIRRYAAHRQSVLQLLDTGNSLVITPQSDIWTKVTTIKTPENNVVINKAPKYFKE